MVSEFFIDFQNERIACALFSNESEKLVVFVSALMQHKSELEHFTTMVCKRFLLNNVDSLIFDYIGCGDSTGDAENITLESMYKTTEKVLDFIEQEMKNKYKEIYLVGYGIGYTIIGTLLHERQRDFIYSTIGINPFFSYEREESVDRSTCNQYLFYDKSISENRFNNFEQVFKDINSKILLMSSYGLRFGDFGRYEYYQMYFEINPNFYYEILSVKKGLFKLGIKQFIIISDDDIRLSVGNELNQVSDDEYIIEYIKNGSIDYRTPMEKDEIYKSMVKWINQK